MFKVLPLSVGWRSKKMPFEDFAMADRGEISSQEAGFDRIVAKCDGDVDKLPEYVQ